jgi:hypothetical protein
MSRGLPQNITRNLWPFNVRFWPRVALGIIEIRTYPVAAYWQEAVIHQVSFSALRPAGVGQLQTLK